MGPIRWLPNRIPVALLRNTPSRKNNLDAILFDLVTVSYGRVKLGFHLFKQLQAASC